MIRPTAFNADGSVDIWHDEMNHGGTATATHVRFGRDEAGNVNPRQLVLSCPVAGCNSETTHHPIGDGLARPEIQRLYARVWLDRAAEIGIPKKEQTWDGVKAKLADAVADVAKQSGLTADLFVLKNVDADTDEAVAAAVVKDAEDAKAAADAAAVEAPSG